MAGKAKQTEHAGSKKGRGAYYGHKGEAKRASSRRRREDARRLWHAARRSHPDDHDGAP
jgi:hypothetical protein